MTSTRAEQAPEAQPTPWWDLRRRVPWALRAARGFGWRRRWDPDTGRSTLAGASQWAGWVELPAWLLLSYTGRLYVFDRGGCTMGSRWPWRSLPGAVLAALPMSGLSFGGVAMVSTVLWAAWLAAGLVSMIVGALRRWSHVRAARIQEVTLASELRLWPAAAREATLPGGPRPRLVQGGNLVAEPGSGGLAFARAVVEAHCRRGYAVLVEAGDQALLTAYQQWRRPVPGHSGWVVIPPAAPST